MQNGATASTKWSDSIDDFGPMKPEAASCLATVKDNTKAQNALYEGTMKPTEEEKAARKDKEKRTIFLDYLQTEILPKLERQQPANENGIKLADLLGPEGMKKYKEAVEEEVRSRAFRDAVFQRSTNHYPGEKWDKRVIAPFAGPSAAGKSVSQPALIAEIGKVVPKKTGDNTGNDVVSIDGGVEREVSQIRGMVLQVALAKGYKGITDLDDNKSKVKIKESVENAALAVPGLSIVIPETYTDEATSLLQPKNLANIVTANPLGIVGKEEFAKYDAQENSILAFGIVEAHHENVVKNGNSRAWNATEFTEADIQMNKKPPCESKAYHDHYLAGTTLSHAARDNYNKLAAEGQPRICVTVNSDFTFIKPNPSVPGGWSLAEKDEPWNKDMIGILHRDFDRYSSAKKAQVSEFEGIKGKLSALNMVIEKQKADLAGMNHSSPEGMQKLKSIAESQKKFDDLKQRMTDLHSEVRGEGRNDIKGWLKANGGWSPPIISTDVKMPTPSAEQKPSHETPKVKIDAPEDNDLRSKVLSEPSPAGMHHGWLNARKSDAGSRTSSPMRSPSNSQLERVNPQTQGVSVKIDAPTGPENDLRRKVLTEQNPAGMHHGWLNARKSDAGSRSSSPLPQQRSSASIPSSTAPEAAAPSEPEGDRRNSRSLK